jgi:hypothetical protein
LEHQPERPVDTHNPPGGVLTKCANNVHINLTYLFSPSIMLILPKALRSKYEELFIITVENLSPKLVSFEESEGK